jgi:hypothetical protein
MKKAILLFSFCTLFAGASFAQGNAKPAAKSDAAAENKNQPEIKFEAEEYNFGTVKQGDVVNYEFKFTNTGKEPLVINEAHGSCGCTVPEWPKEPIKKGQTGTIKVSFNTAGKMGTQDKTVTITSNAKTTSKVLHLKGTVVEKTDNTLKP